MNLSTSRRPDSVIDGINVYQSRVEAGKRLAIDDDVQADMVIGVPDSALAAAMGYAQQSGIPYGDGLAKNRYVGRTFIQPEQGMRELGVRTKLNALTRNVRGKRLILVDDSIVRGTTSRKIVEMLRTAGAKEVHMRISSPSVLNPCYFGIDTATSEELIGHSRSAGGNLPLHRGGQPQISFPARSAQDGGRFGLPVLHGLL